MMSNPLLFSYRGNPNIIILGLRLFGDAGMILETIRLSPHATTTA